MTTMITVTIVITCFIQNCACSCRKICETSWKEDQNIDWVTLYRTASSQPVRERALIFTLPDYMSHLRATVASFITDIKGLGGFPLFGLRPFTASYLPKPPGEANILFPNDISIAPPTLSVIRIRACVIARSCIRRYQATWGY